MLQGQCRALNLYPGAGIRLIFVFTIYVQANGFLVVLWRITTKKQVKTWVTQEKNSLLEIGSLWVFIFIAVWDCSTSSIGYFEVKGTGSRLSACSLIKLLFSNLLLILSINNSTHMYLSDLRV